MEINHNEVILLRNPVNLLAVSMMHNIFTTSLFNLWINLVCWNSRGKSLLYLKIKKIIIKRFD